jgi:hypothetical protein
MNNEIRNLFDYLNDNCSYIVLRNWENLFEKDIYSNGHEDIDILCENLEEFVSLTNAHRIHQENSRDNFIILWNTIKVRVDVRWVGDGYYPTEMERTMLTNRVQNQQGIFIPGKIDFYYSLSYHALVQKPLLSDEYIIKLNSLRQNKFEVIREQVELNLLEELRNYLIANSWQVEYPNDPGVYLNKRVLNQLPVSNNYIRIVKRDIFHVKRVLMGYIRRIFVRLSIS